MSKLLKSFYHNLKEPIIILDNLSLTFYQNKACKDVFGELSQKLGFGAIKKIGYKFHFDFCILDSENINKTPFDDAINSKLPFLAYGIYQKNEGEYLYLTIKAFSLKRYRIIYFYDCTKELECEKILEENEKLKVQNQKFANLNSKAQNQAIKMALLNRISTSISKSLNINTLISTALSELGIVFAANKLYFAKRISENEFEIEFTYPEKLNLEEKRLIYNKEITNKLYENKISKGVTLKEHDMSDIVLKQPMTRIIMPITKHEALYGIIVIFCSKKNITETEDELLVGISMQISNSLLGASLFNEVIKQKEEIQKTLEELKETQLQLINSEKMASLGQLIASVAHEINTPLASISANNEILKKLFSKLEVKSDIKEIFDETNKIDFDAIKRISNLVLSLKRFVRLDETVRQRADINNELDLTLEILRHKTKNGISIIKKYGKIKELECYPNMLNQVFLNILMNAIQSIEKEKEAQNAEYTGEIEIITKNIKNDLVVKIVDNGSGISELNKKRIFQAGFTTKKVGEGTGLGLAICKKIVEKHSGKITFNSVIPKNGGKKTSFTITIPMVG